MKKVLLVVLVIAGGLLLLKRRRAAKPENAIEKAIDMVRKSDLPDRTKDRMVSTLDGARDGLTHLREAAEHVAKRAS